MRHREIRRGVRTFVTGLSACFCVCASSHAAAFATQEPVQEPVQETKSVELRWNDWSADLFSKAEQEKKFVLLDLHAVWCHWCHVMDQKTYANPEVAKLLQDYFITVKVDQDSRPDLASKYGDYGWPATVLFASNGKEVDIEQGFVPPEKMVRILSDVIEHKKISKLDFGAEPVTAGSGSLTQPLRKELERKHVDGFDSKLAGWGFDQKFLDWDSVEYSIDQSAGGDKAASERARRTLDAQRQLIDPVWGGVYQYSTHGDWEHPHFEKIMQMQAENMRIYSFAFLLYNDPNYLKAARHIEKFLRSFLLSPQGAFYTSMDADIHPGEHSSGYFELDDAARRKLGLPAIDQHIYTRENGWAISALTALYGATGEKGYLDEAIAAAEFIQQNRALPDGGFKHGEEDKAGPFLGDTLAMGRAYLTLYEVTGDRKWLTKSERCADFITKHFSFATKKTAVGFSAAASTAGITSFPTLDENVAACRYFNLLNQYSGRAADRAAAVQAMRFVGSPQSVRSRTSLVAGMLLADQEMSKEPFHLVTVGPKVDAQAVKLFTASLHYPLSYRRIEWYDAAEGVLPNSSIEYPTLHESAVFVCGNNTCSAPQSDVETLAKKIKSFIKL